MEDYQTDPRLFLLIPEGDELLDAAHDLIAPEAYKEKTENLHWIVGYEGEVEGVDVDEAQNFCWNCAKKIVVSLDALHGRERDEYSFQSGSYDVFIDGGWGHDQDGMEFCEKCGVLLENSYTDYGFESELDHYLHYGIASVDIKSEACRRLVDSLTIPDSQRERAEELANRIIWNFIISGT